MPELVHDCTNKRTSDRSYIRWHGIGRTNQNLESGSHSKQALNLKYIPSELLQDK